MTSNRGTDELTAFLAQRGDHLMRSAAQLPCQLVASAQADLHAVPLD